MRPFIKLDKRISVRSKSRHSSPYCHLCQNKGSFNFTPKYPEHLLPIAHRLDLIKSSSLTCPFCSRRRQYVSEEVVNVKAEIDEMDYSIFTDDEIAQGRF